jgi:hypothetical protein
MPCEGRVAPGFSWSPIRFRFPVAVTGGLLLWMTSEGTKSQTLPAQIRQWRAPNSNSRRLREDGNRLRIKPDK